MAKIKKLSREVVSQIAAGEVIERPSFVVKELIENALDANATDIEINIKNFGLGEIEVVDNGRGMGRNDLLQSFLPHTTSKLHSIEELSGITSLGFRGEALSSIASVADLLIESREHDQSKGYFVHIRDQSIFDKGVIGKNYGTRVLVTNIFENIPARKKFLKSSLTELRLISEIVMYFVFSHPEVNFSLTHNGKSLINEPASDLSTRIESTWGKSTLSQMLPLNKEDSLIKITGFLGKPQLTSSNSKKLWIYVNGRKVVDELLSTAIKDAFNTLLMARLYPIGIIFLTVPKEIVDVNVHPTKREVRFLKSEDIFQEVKNAIHELLEENNLSFYNASFSSNGFSVKEELRDEILNSEIAQIGKVISDEILQVHQSFLIVETKNGFQIIDQHAAHESLLYFEFLKAWEKKQSAKTSIRLSPPQILELTVNNALLAEEYKDTLENLGFSIEQFGKNTFRVKKIPKFYKDQNLKEVLENILNFLSEGNKKLTAKEHLMLATLACKSALKAGQFLTLEQRQKLVHALTEKHYAYTCPHGRPVKIEISLPKLMQMFKR